MTLLFIDDFESATATGGTRSATAHTDTANGTGSLGPGLPGPGGVGDYFYRTMTTGQDLGTGEGQVFTGFNGSWIWRGEDVEDSAGGAANPALGFINWTGIDITGSTGLEVSGLFGSGGAGPTFAFEIGDFVTLSYSIDGGAFVSALSFIGSGVATQGLIWDENNNGVIDGGETTQITTAMANFTFAIAGTGTTLALQLETNVGVSEEIAFDDIQVNDDAAAANMAPVASAIEGTNVLYQENGGAQQITNTYTLSDADDTDMESATIVISAGHNATNDMLHFTNQNGITGSFVGNTLTLTGTSSVANYITAIRSITYENLFTTNDTTQRSFTITVNDGDDNSNTQARNFDFNVDETINGGAGNDRLRGGFGDDVIDGQGGNNTIFGNDGNDTLSGGSGNDRFWGDAGEDSMTGGSGTDSAYYTRAPGAVTLNTVTGGTGGEALGDTFSSIERFIGSTFGDNMTVGSAIGRVLMGLGGNDTLNGNSGADILIGGTGNDTINGGGGNDRIFGNEGSDTLNGDGGNDVIVSGDDGGTINGGADNDTMLAGSGAEAFDGGTGTDRVVYSTSTTGVTLNMGTGGTGGDAAGDTYTGVENVYGSLLADDITGDSGANLLVGQAGADTLNGGAGNDRLVGGDGDDTLNGGADNDTLFGGNGADTFAFSGMSTGSDRIADWVDGSDMIDLTGWGTVANFADLTITQVGVHVQITEGSGAGTITVLNATAADFTLADFVFPTTAEKPGDDGNLVFEPASSFSLDDDFGDLYAAPEMNDALFGEMPALLAGHYEAKALASEMADYGDFYMDALL